MRRGALVDVLTAADPALRNTAFETVCADASLDELLAESAELNRFRETSQSLYERVRALFFLAALHRYEIPRRLPPQVTGLVPYDGYSHLLNRRYQEAIDEFEAALRRNGPSEAISSAIAAAARGLAFQTLADQVRRSVRSVRGNQWMFRMGHTSDYPLRIRPELKKQQDGMFPVLFESTPVRMDLSHSGWSDIFFLGMDFPEGARVLNVSVDLSIRGTVPKPPVEAYFRVIDEPVLRLVSIDLNASVTIDSLAEVFDFAADYLGLLKAAVIASGLIPPGLEGSGQPLAPLLAKLTGIEGHGIEIVSKVNDIPKGSRLAVSTNLLACLISVCMRATSQIGAVEGTLCEDERRTVAARAILGEWLGGSGGGWQDSGGVWPGIKLIQGVVAQPGDVEYGVSRGCLLPRHHILDTDQVDERTRELLQQSLVLVHGGMAQDVGPVLEMVTEKYLLRSAKEWEGRKEAITLLDAVLSSLRNADIAGIGRATQRNFDGPIQTIIPWAANRYTEMLIERVRAEFGSGFLGFCMLGGMSGGGMAFLFEPGIKAQAQDRLSAIMSGARKELEAAVPFAMHPVVYDFAINTHGTSAVLRRGGEALMPVTYYHMTVPSLVRQEIRSLPYARRSELMAFQTACSDRPEFSRAAPLLIEHLLPRAQAQNDREDLDSLLEACGFDTAAHEKIRSDLRTGKIGLARNALPASTLIEDARQGDVIDLRAEVPSRLIAIGNEALRAGAAAIVTLAGGAGTRWTRGAGVVKAVNPFCSLGGAWRNFIDIHLAKSARTAAQARCCPPHAFTTSFLTHPAIETDLERNANYGYRGPVYLSPGRAVGLRLVPMVRDLRYLWEELPQQTLDEQKQKVRDSLRAGLLEWARRTGEGTDYRDNLPSQCIHPVGHWYELPNMLLNGALARLLEENPAVQHVLLHNIDTLGATLDPALLGAHIEGGSVLTVEVIPRVVDDRGGGLARVNGRLRLVEGIAVPSEEAEFSLSYYNSGTMWMDVDKLLTLFGLDRSRLRDSAAVAAAVRAMADRMPAYVTIKDVKKRWGRGQEDVFPVTQFERLWGDMTALPGVTAVFAAVPRVRGLQLKDVAQLDGWWRDGSAAHVAELCGW